MASGYNFGGSILWRDNGEGVKAGTEEGEGDRGEGDRGEGDRGEGDRGEGDRGEGGGCARLMAHLSFRVPI